MSADGDHPEDLKYHEEHDWVRVEGNVAEFGITWHAQDALGDLVHFDPPEPGDTVTANEAYGELESVKAVSDVVAPCDGEVVEVNGEVVESPEMLNEDPYSAWLIKVRLDDPSQLDELMSAEEYSDMLDSADGASGESPETAPPVDTADLDDDIDDDGDDDPDEDF